MLRTSNPSYIVERRPFKPKQRQHLPQVRVPDVEELKISNALINSINEVVRTKNYGRLFAVVHYNGKQFKVTADDLIVVQDMQHFSVGDLIRLEKILMVGSESFSFFGRPLIPRTSVTVEAKVIEKTFSETRVDYLHVPRKSIEHMKLYRKPLSILRITKVELLETVPLVDETRNVWKDRM